MTSRAALALVGVSCFLSACGSSDPDTTSDTSMTAGATNNATTGDTTGASNTTSGTGDPSTACLNEGTPGATASCLTPTRSPEYYADEANKYFDTLDIDADRSRIPDYSPRVARWEWPPWLLLTGYGSEDMIQSGDTLRAVDPSTVPTRDCRGFSEQPFARCYVVFEYEGGSCPIYEEFVFNDQGEMTFIEAWSHLPGFMPMDPEADPWAEGAGVARLSTRVPGLGNAEGLIDLDSAWMRSAAEADPDVADFALRASDPWRYWGEAFNEADPNFFAIGCGWPIDGE